MIIDFLCRRNSIKVWIVGDDDFPATNSALSDIKAKVSFGIKNPETYVLSSIGKKYFRVSRTYISFNEEPGLLVFYLGHPFRETTDEDVDSFREQLQWYEDDCDTYTLVIHHHLAWKWIPLYKITQAGLTVDGQLSNNPLTMYRVIKKLPREF